MTKLGLLFLAGGCGCLARFGLAGLVQRLYGGEFPAGTLVVNMLGCFLFGIVWPLADERLVISPDNRILILTGFMGSFTTFSTFAFDSSQMVRNAEWLFACGNILFHVVIGVLAVMMGMALSRWW